MTNSLPFTAIDRPAIYVQVAEQIRRAILERSLSSGDRLPPERELAQMFEVSRATVREALRHLQAQGLLTSRGRTSPMQTASPEQAVARFREALTYVVQLREVPLADLVELRAALETTALTRAAASPVVAELAAAHAALEIMERPDVKSLEFYDADVAFHVALVAASGNQALHLAMLAVKDAIRLHLEEFLRPRSFAALRPAVVAEHRAILRALERRDAKTAVALVRKHLESYAT